MLDMIDKIIQFAPMLMAAAVAFVLLALVYDQHRKRKHAAIHFGAPARAHGIIFGKRGARLAYSPENAEGHIGVFSASGTGKTAAIGIPTLRSWQEIFAKTAQKCRIN